MENKIWIILPDYDREGYGCPYNDQYFTSLEEAKKVCIQIKNSFYDYEIIELTHKIN